MKNYILTKSVLVFIFSYLIFAFGCSDEASEKQNNNTTNNNNNVNNINSENNNDSTELEYQTDLSNSIVVTKYGPIKGIKSNGVTRFLGIPYAAPPVGDLRWAPPNEPEKWQELRECTNYEYMCPQKKPSLLDAIIGRAPIYSDDCPEDCEGEWCCIGSEDCLYLNVWTPAEDKTEKLPVMIWIHGGSWQSGYTSHPWLDGQHLAEQGVVLVSIEYRLNILGFLAHSDLATDQDGHAGNYGILDQIAAINWVKDNISEFGGDPQDILVFGESAGAGSICILLASPLSKNLFNKAILESLGCMDRYEMRYLDTPTPRSEAISAYEQGQYAQNLLGCNDATDPIECMRQKSVVEIFEMIHPDYASFLFPYVYKPIIDGYVLEDAPLRVFMNEPPNADMIVYGHNSHELGFWRWSGVFKGFGIQGYRLSDADNTEGVIDKYGQLLQKWFGDKHEEALNIWGDPTTGSDAIVFYENMVGDIVFDCHQRRVIKYMDLQGAQVRRYLFKRVPANSFAEKERLGAVHAAEIKYVFGNMELPEAYYKPLTSDDYSLSSVLLKDWASFAKIGEPDPLSTIDWTTGWENTTVIDVTSDATGDYKSDICNFIDTVRDSTLCEQEDSVPWVCLF